MKLEKDARMTEIFVDYHRLVMYSVNRDITCFEDSLDICQDVYVAFYVKFRIEEVKEMSNARAKALLLRIAKNKVVDYIRKRIRIPMIYLEDCRDEAFLKEELTYSIENLVMNRELLKEICADLKNAGDDCRDLVLLHAVDGLSHEMVSELLGIPPSALRTRLCRYRKWLREKYRIDD